VRLGLEVLEERSLLSASHLRHVLLLSVDGLHEADLVDPALRPYETNILALERAGIHYTNAHTTRPSDSFPGTLSYLTGAGPGTTGIFYDDAYDRKLFAPGSSTPGTETTYFEAIDFNSALISGGGNFDASSIDPSKLPHNKAGKLIYPHDFLKVNTIFEVAHKAGLYTAFSDKHPAYDIANGPSGTGLDDFYGPEINSTTALLDNSTGKTVDANALLAADPFADLSNFTLVDPGTDPMGPNDPNLINDTTHNLLLTEKYDDLKVQAILNEIDGLPSHPSPTILHAMVPNIFGMNFQAVSVAQKYFAGGIVSEPFFQAPSMVLEAALLHTDASIGKIVAELQGHGLWGSTELFLLAKHGQAPRVGAAGLMADSTLPNILQNAGAPVAQATQDDVSLIWLQDQSTTKQAVDALKDFKANGTLNVFFRGAEVAVPASMVINKILSGPALVKNGFGDPAKNSRTPDIIVSLHPGFIWVGNPAHFTFKRAEHGGFSDDDTHVALIVSGGLVHKHAGTVQDDLVHLTQVAVTALDVLGLDPNQLQGAVAEGTQALPVA
jgi:hypothetical protein